MKKLFFITLDFFASVNLNAQTPTWVCMNVSVDQNGQADFVEALDNFMESLELNPYTVTLNQVQFGSSDVDFSHQLCFLGQSSEAFASWGIGGPPASVEGVLFFSAFQDFVEVEQIILGQPMIFEPSNLDSDFAAVFALNVTDVQKFGSAFTKMVNSSNNENGSFELHDAVLGAEKDVTHYWVARSGNISTFLDGRSEFLSSGSAAKFISDAGDSFEFVFGFGARIIKRYNN